MSEISPKIPDTYLIGVFFITPVLEWFLEHTFLYAKPVGPMQKLYIGSKGKILMRIRWRPVEPDLASGGAPSDAFRSKFLNFGWTVLHVFVDFLTQE